MYNRELEESGLVKLTVQEYSSSVPVTVDQVKSYLNYSGTGQDTELLRMIQSAIRQVERYTGFTIVEKTYLAQYTRGNYADLTMGPVISIDSALNNDTAVTFTQQGDRVYPANLFTLSTYGQPYDLFITYKAGFLRPVSVASNVVTLTAHGYSDGDQVALYGITGATDGTLYTVSSATANTFEVGEALTDGSGYAGVIDPMYIEAVIMQAAENFLRGEASAGLSNKVKTHLSSLRSEAIF